MWSTKTSRSKRKRFKQKRASPLRKAPKRQCPVPPPGENKRAKTPKPVASPKLIKLSTNGSQSQSHTWPLQSHGHAQGEVSQHTSHSIDRNTDADIEPHTATAASPRASLSCTPPPSMSLSAHSQSPPIWPSPSASAMGTRSRPSSSRSLSAYQSLSPPPGSVYSATLTTPRMLSSTSSLPMSMPTGDGNAGNAVSAVNIEISADQSDERDEDVDVEVALKREMVSYEQALSEVTSRFEQLTRDNEMVASSGANSAEHSLSMQRNKELLCFGFIREHTRLTVTETETASASRECDPDLDADFEEDGLGVGERMSVPRDIMRFIFQHYDNTMVWDVRGAHFEAFTRKETLKGPCFAIENVLRLNANNANTKSNSANTNANANNADAKDNVDDHSAGEDSEDIAMCAAMSIEEETSLCLELELSHKEHADFVSCYLVSSRVPKGVQSMLISFTLFLRELQYECRSTMCYEDEDDAKGWNALAVPFGELRGLESLHIECSVDILDIRFLPTAAECVNARAVERVMSAVPPMRDCLFLWHITRAQMELFRGGSAKRYRYHYSDNFNNNCFVLGCDPHFNLEEFPDEEPKVLLALNMLRAPQEVQAVTLKVEFAAFADHRCFRHHQTTTLQLDAYETSCDELLFSSAMLQQLTALSFMVELKVIEIKYKEY